MPVTKRIKNMDEYFHSVSGLKIIVNQMALYNSKEDENLSNLLITVYNKDVLDTVPSCSCGKLKGAAYLGITCDNCSEEVTEFHKKVDPILWLKTLSDDIPFINPYYYMSVRYILDKKNDWLRWLGDSQYNPNVNIPPYLYGVRDTVLNGERTYSNLLTNFHKVLKYLINHNFFLKQEDKRDELILALETWVNKKEDILSTYMPIVNKKLFVMENTTKGKFTTLTVADIYDVVLTWRTVSNTNLNVKRKETATLNVIHKLTTFFYNYFKKYLLKKPGLFRKHLYGARSGFTFRSVIVSIPGKHAYDEIHVPWAIGIATYRPHILNKLYKLGFNYRDANKKLTRAVKKFDNDISLILDELISETSGKRIPVLAQRNPSLLPGSSEKVGISKFKKYVHDHSIGISSKIVKAMNGGMKIILIIYARYNRNIILKPF